jgi:hypothetical protein
MDELFDETNEWHIQANHLLYFICRTSSCHAQVTIKDLPKDQQDMDWLGLCVALSDVAQSRGWTFVSRLEFLCPRCSAARLAV